MERPQLDPIEIDAVKLVTTLRDSFAACMMYAEATWQTSEPIAIQARLATR